MDHHPSSSYRHAASMVCSTYALKPTQAPAHLQHCNVAIGKTNNDLPTFCPNYVQYGVLEFVRPYHLPEEKRWSTGAVHTRWAVVTPNMCI